MRALSSQSLALIVLATGARALPYRRVVGVFPSHAMENDTRKNDLYWSDNRATFLRVFAGDRPRAVGFDATTFPTLLAEGPPEELVVVGNFQPGDEDKVPNLADQVVALLEAGTLFVSMEHDITRFVNATRLDEARHSYWSYLFDSRPGAHAVAAEVCRLTGRGFHHQLVQVFGSHSDDRVLEQVSWLTKHCEATFDIVDTARSLSWSADEVQEDLFQILAVHSTVTTVISASNGMLLGAFEAEKAIDEWRRSSDILNVGWDGHDFDVISQKGTIIAAGQIDLFSLYSRIRYGIGIAETHNLTTAAQFMKYLRNRPVPSFRVPTGAKYDDERGFALRSALTLYEPLVAPKPPHLGLLPVVYSLLEISIDEIDTAGGSFESTFWIQIEWNDHRLAHKGEPFFIDTEKIWTPDIFFPNSMTAWDDFVVVTPPATVQDDGNIPRRGADLDPRRRVSPPDATRTAASPRPVSPATASTFPQPRRRRDPFPRPWRRRDSLSRPPAASPRPADDSRDAGNIYSASERRIRLSDGDRAVPVRQAPMSDPDRGHLPKRAQARGRKGVGD